MKNVVIISSTLRANGNFELLAKEFEKGAKEVLNHKEYLQQAYNMGKNC